MSQNHLLFLHVLKRFASPFNGRDGDRKKARLKCRGAFSSHVAEGTKCPADPSKLFLFLDESHCLLFWHFYICPPNSPNLDSNLSGGGRWRTGSRLATVIAPEEESKQLNTPMAAPEKEQGGVPSPHQRVLQRTHRGLLHRPSSASFVTHLGDAFYQGDSGFCAKPAAEEHTTHNPLVKRSAVLL